MTTFRAPLRIGLFGGGTDLPEYFMEHGPGRVLNMAITRYAYARAEVSATDKYAIFSTNKQAWLPHDDQYLMPAMRAMSPGLPMTAFVSTDAPINTGLGGSSALMVALTAACEQRVEDLSPGSLAYRAGTFERIHANAHIGMQDHYAAAYGGVNLFEFHSGRVVVENMNRQIPPPFIRDFAWRLFLVRLTRVARSASDILVRLGDRAQKKDAETLASLEWSTNAALQGARLLSARNWGGFADLLNEAWQHKRRLGTTSNAAHQLISFARQWGALAGKECGAGGYILLFVDPNRKAELVSKLDGLKLVAESVEIDYDGIKCLDEGQ